MNTTQPLAQLRSTLPAAVRLDCFGDDVNTSTETHAVARFPHSPAVSMDT